MTTWNYSPVELKELFYFIKISAFTDSICFSAPSTQVPSFSPLTFLSLLVLFLLAEWFLHHQSVAGHAMDSFVLASLRLVKWSTLQLPTLKRPGLWKKKSCDFPQTAIAKLRIPATSTGGIPDAYHPFVGRTLKILCYSYLEHTARVYYSISDNGHDTEPVCLLTNGCTFENIIF